MAQRGKPYPYVRQHDWWSTFNFAWAAPLQLRGAVGFSTYGTVGGGWGSNPTSDFPTYDNANGIINYNFQTPATANPRSKLQVRIVIQFNANSWQNAIESRAGIDSTWGNWTHVAFTGDRWFGGIGRWRFFTGPCGVFIPSSGDSFGIANGEWESLTWSETTAWPPDPF